MPIPKKVMMKRLRDARLAAGLVELKVWVRPEQVDAIKYMAKLAEPTPPP